MVRKWEGYYSLLINGGKIYETIKWWTKNNISARVTVVDSLCDLGRLEILRPPVFLVFTNQIE